MPAPTANMKQLAEHGQTRYRAGDYQGAADTFETLVKSDGDNPEARYLLATALTHLGKYREAEGHLKKALRIRPREPKYRSQLGVVYKQSGELDEAQACIDEALKLDPGLPQAVRVKAELLRLYGQHEQAVELLRSVVASGAAPAAMRTLYGRLVAKVEDVDAGVRILHDVFNDTTATDAQRAHAAFELGRLLDQEGRYDEAFDAFREGNLLRKPAFDPDDHIRKTDRAIEWWTRKRIESLPISTVTEDRFVFIVGMPRSGTSLIEQILASHPECFGGGELPDVLRAAHDIAVKLAAGAEIRRPDIDKPARAYARNLKKLAREAKRVTDKMPQNFLQLGLIQVMFPNARIVHSTRDPMDTCLSCYFQEFSAAHAYSYDLAWLADYHNQYRRLMTHWQSVLDLPILDVSYEGLVADQERVSREMLDFVGLAWDDGCLRFHETDRVAATQSNEQVTEKMYTRALGRHRNYSSHLGPLREGLVDA